MTMNDAEKHELKVRFNQVCAMEIEKLNDRTEGFKNGVKVALNVGGEGTSKEAKFYYMECRRRGHDMADGFEYGLLMKVRILKSISELKKGKVS